MLLGLIGIRLHCATAWINYSSRFGYNVTRVNRDKIALCLSGFLFDSLVLQSCNNFAQYYYW